MKDDTKFDIMAGFFLLIAIVFWIVVGYVIYHFINKWW